MTAGTGSLSPTTSTRVPGIYETTHTPGDRTATSASISAAFTSAEGAAATCELQIRPELPEAVRITADRTTFVAGSGALNLRVELDFRGERPPLSITRLAVEPSLGTATAPVRGADGLWELTWTLPDRFVRAHEASLRIHVPSHEVVSGTLRVALAPAAPAQFDLELPGTLRGDGRDGGMIAVQMSDSFGNAIEAPQLEMTALGDLGAIVTADDKSRARYTAPHTRVARHDIVEIRDPISGLATRGTIRLEPLSPRYQVGTRLGVLSNLGRVTAPILQLSASARLPVLGEALVADVSLGGYSAAIQERATDETISGRLNVAPMIGRVAYHLTRSGFDLWGGAGAGVAIWSTAVAAPSAGTVTRRGAAITVTGFSGAARRMGVGWLIVELAYLHARIDGAVRGRIGGVVGTVGYGFDL